MDDISVTLEKIFHEIDAGKIYGNIIEYIEKTVIIKALERSCGNQVQAAKLLGLHRNTVHSKIKKLNINVGRFKK